MMRSRLLAALSFAGACAIVPAGARAQAAACRTDTLTAGFPASWFGARVGQLEVDATTVEAPGGLAGNVVRSLHSRTRFSIPMYEMSVQPGAVVDSLEVLESVRRLRRTGLYSEVTLTGSRCEQEQLDLVVHTRDAWSMRTDVRYGRTSSRVSLSEVNLFWRAVRASVTAENVDSRSSVSVGLSDPYLMGSHVRGSVVMRAYDDGRAWSWFVRSADFSPRDLWRFSVLSTQLRQFRNETATQSLEDISRRTDAASAALRTSADDDRVYAFVFGVEHEQAELHVEHPGSSLGKTNVNREFSAPFIGLVRRSLRVGAVDWLVPGQPRAELPIGVEGEIVAGAGYEDHSRSTIVHIDGWLGLTAKPTSGTVVTGDVWASGYYLLDSLANGAVRASMAVYERGFRGIWALRLATERLVNPDPDVYALSTSDPVLRSLAPSTRLAESAITASLERSVTLYSTEGRWAVDAVPFVQYSERHRSVDITLPEPTNPQAVLLGIGWRRVRNQPTQAPLRLDIAKTVWLRGGLPNRWVFVLSTQPWLAQGRNRDGLREIVR